MLLKLSTSPSSRICTQCLHRIQRLRPSSTSIQLLSRRTFSRSRILSSAPKLKLGRSGASSTPSREKAGDYAKELNMTLSVPTVIYEAPSHKAFIVAASGLSLFFAGYGILQAWSPGLGFIFGTPPAPGDNQIAWIIPPLLIVVGGVFLGISVWSYGAIRNLVKRITVLPRGENGSMLAQIEVTRLLPFRRHTIDLPLSCLSLGRRVQDVAPSATETMADRQKRIAESSIFLRPFMRTGSFAKHFFDETSNVFWRSPFVTLDMGKEGKFILDARGAAYKGAVGLDRIIGHDFGKGKFWEGMG